jgi:hypothetical protein
MTFDEKLALFKAKQSAPNQEKPNPRGLFGKRMPQAKFEALTSRLASEGKARAARELSFPEPKEQR